MRAPILYAALASACLLAGCESAPNRRPVLPAATEVAAVRLILKPNERPGVRLPCVSRCKTHPPRVKRQRRHPDVALGSPSACAAHFTRRPAPACRPRFVSRGAPPPTASTRVGTPAGTPKSRGTPL